MMEMFSPAAYPRSHKKLYPAWTWRAVTSEGRCRRQALAVPYGGGCSLYVGLPFSLIAVVGTELDGTLSLTLPVPNEPALAGIPIHFQGLVQDPQAFLGAAATNGLEALFGS